MNIIPIRIPIPIRPLSLKIYIVIFFYFIFVLMLLSAQIKRLSGLPYAKNFSLNRLKKKKKSLKRFKQT